MCDASATYEYKLLLNKNLLGHKLNIEIFPELNIIYGDYQNNLCLSRYDSGVRCVWEGDIKVTLIVNGKTIVLNDHDTRHNIVHKVGQYEFQGDNPIVENRSRDHTYLIFTIRKCKQIDNDINFALGQSFIIEHGENRTTGYQLTMHHSNGLQLLNDTYFNQCKLGMTGCGGIRKFTFKGIRRGPQKVELTYGRPWDPNTNDIKEYHINIV